MVTGWIISCSTILSSSDLRRSRNATGTRRGACWAGLTVLSTLMRYFPSSCPTFSENTFRYRCRMFSLDKLSSLLTVKTADPSVVDLLMASLLVYVMIFIPMHAFRPNMGRMWGECPRSQPVCNLTNTSHYLAILSVVLAQLQEVGILRMQILLI